MAEVRISRLQNPTAWHSWVGGELCDYSPKDAPFEDVMAALAKYALEHRKSVAVINNTHQHHRIVGWGYTPQGYIDTPDGPRLWLLCIEGDVLRETANVQSHYLPQNELETLISCLRHGINPQKAVTMLHEDRLRWHINNTK